MGKEFNNCELNNTEGRPWWSSGQVHLAMWRMWVIPGWGTEIPHAMEPLSLHATTTGSLSRNPVPQLQSLCIATKDPAWCNEDPAGRN